MALALALRNLSHEKIRLTLSVAGVALAITLILLLNGFYRGLLRQVSAYLDHTPGSIVVAPADVSGFLSGMSLLAPETLDAVRAAEGVAAAVPIVFQGVVLDLHGKKVFTYVVGYDPECGGGPWRMAEGRQPQDDGQIVVDWVMARRHGPGLGDRLDILGRRFVVTGLSDATAGFMASFVFVRRGAAAALTGAPGATSFVLVTPAPGTTVDALVERLTAQLRAAGDTAGAIGPAAGAPRPPARALLKEELVRSDLKLIARVYGAALHLMVGVAFSVGALVVGMVVYTATVERQREYGVLKAVGARNGLLYAVVTAQALVAASLGALAGTVLVLGVARIIMEVRPQFRVAIEPGDALTALAAGSAMALLAALLPARVVAGLAPADVFRR